MNPILHVGGVQDAITAAPPLRGVEKAPVLVMLTTFGSEEFQLRNDPVMVVPEESVIVGVMVPEVLLGTVIELPLWLFTASEMDATRQVSKSMGTLVVLEMLAKIGVTPGTLALNCAWPGNRPVAVVF